MAEAKNNSHQKPHLEELTWAQVRADVHKVNPELAEIIDKLNPGREYTLFKARYPYGAEILRRGDLHLPNAQGEIVSLTHSTIPNHIQDKLGYNLNSNPVTLVLKNSIELFLTMDDRTVPFYGLMSAGKMFGTWRILKESAWQQPKFIWDMTSGARSIFMLPKISEIERHKKLKKTFHLNTDEPKTLIDHWQIFKEIANHSNFSQHWFSEVLFFSKQWFQNLDDNVWIEFNYYLFRTMWSESEFWRNQFVWSLIFSLIQKKRNIKPNPYIADTVKHIIAIGIGAVTGFSPSVDSSAAPIEGLQEVYLKVYNLKNYPPVIFQPQIFSMQNKTACPVYYSLQFPTAIEFSPKTRDRSSLITDLYETRSLLNKYLTEILDDRLNIEATAIYDMATQVEFDYFHSDAGQYHGIRSSEEIIEDSIFKQIFDKFSNKKFPSNSGFVRGCVRISHKK